MNRASELRAAFDRSFAEALELADRTKVDLLAIRLGGEPFALVLTDVTSVHVDLPIVRVPSTAKELVGVASIRASILPVYDLRVLLGTSTDGPLRWTVVAVGAAVAYSFDGFDGMFRRHSELPQPRSERGLRGAIEHDGLTRPLVDLVGVTTLSRQRWSKEPE